MKKIFTLFVATFVTLAMFATAISEYPYTNGFDSETTNLIPAGWTKVAGTDYYPIVDSKANISTRGGSAKALVFQGYSANGEQILALPEFSLDAKYLKLEFYYKTKSSSYPAQFSIGYVTNLADKTSYVKLQDLSYSTDGFTKATQSFESAPDGAYLAIYFKGTGTSSKKGALYVDDVTVSSETPAPSCAEVGAPVASDVTAHGATLTWTAATEVTNYQFVCLEKGTELSWDGVEPKAQLTVSYDNLKSNTEYTFYVRSYCGAGEGEQSLPRKVAFSTELACYTPASLELSNITPEGLTLTWTASGHGETQYQYAVAVAGQTPDAWTPVEGLTVNVSGLQASTNYVAYVRSYCSELDQSDAVSEAFKTPCGAVALPFNEDFSNDIDCWTQKNLTGYSGVTTKGEFAFAWASIPPYQTIITPEIIASEKEVSVTFQYKAHNKDYTESFKVGYSTTTNDLETAFTWSDEVKTNLTSFETYFSILPAGVKYIAIQCWSNNQYYLYLDNFSVAEYEAPKCPAPTALTVSNIAAKSATLAWTSEATVWKYQLSADGENWGEAQAAATNPFELTGLKANTLYYARVQNDCGEDGVSEWTEAVSFTTDCGALSLPYNEDFESTNANELPACWARVSKDGFPVVFADSYYDSRAYAGSKSLKFYGYEVDQIAVLPELEDALSKVALSFWYTASDDAESPVPTVGYITDPANAASYVAVTTLPAASEYTQAKVTFDAAPVGARIAIRYQGGTWFGSLYIDNMEITEKSDEPTAIVNTTTTDKAVKRVINGQVVILKNGLRYNILGTELK